MDKYEYRIKAEQIVKLVGRNDYERAMKIADGIDWNKVRNVQMLCTVSEIYEKNGKYEESRDILFLAYDRSPVGRMIVYRLVELSVLMNDYDEAVAYYKEYEQIAPNDTNIYILKYKIYKGRGATIETLISILEEFKRKDYHEDWAYELARLYHEGGYGDKCVRECDEIDLWFNNGPTVIKALELKMCYQPLSPKQQEKYENRKIFQAEHDIEGLETVFQEDKEEPEFFDDEDDPMPEVNEETPYQPEVEPEQSPLEQHVSKNLSNTVEMKNLFRRRPKDTMVWRALEEQEIRQNEEANTNEEVGEAISAAAQALLTQQRTKEMPPVKRDHIDISEEPQPVVKKESYKIEADDIKISSYQDMPEHKYDTLNLQKELANSIQQLLHATEKETVDSTIRNVKRLVEESNIPELTETMRFRSLRSEMMNDIARKRAAELVLTPEVDYKGTATNREIGKAVPIKEPEENSWTLKPVPEPTLKLKPTKQEKKREMERMLQQEGDGQIGLLVPEEPLVEKQITGQMNIEEILREWEKQKILTETDREKMALEEARRKALEETQEIMNEIMNLLKDVIPKIGSIKDGEERMTSLANSLEKVSNAFPAFSEDLRNSAENIYDEINSMNATSEAKDDDDAADDLEAKIEQGLPESVMVLAKEGEKQENVLPDLFTKEDEAVPVQETPDLMKDDEKEEPVLEEEKTSDTVSDDDLDISLEEDELEKDQEEKLKDLTITQEIGNTGNLEKVFEQMQNIILEDATKEEENFEKNQKVLQGDFSENEQKALKELIHQATLEASQEADASDAEKEDESQDDTEGSMEDRQEQEAAASAEDDDLPVIQDIPDLMLEKSEEGAFELNEEQKTIFSYFMLIGDISQHLTKIIETGNDRIENMIITGCEGSGRTSLAMRIVKAMQVNREDKIETIAKIKADSLNKKDVETIFEKVDGGVLVIEGAGALEENAILSLVNLMEQYKENVQVFLTDTKEEMNRLRVGHDDFFSRFTEEVNLRYYSNAELVEFGKAYAKVKGFEIDDVAVLALFSVIGKMQLGEKKVDLSDIKDIVDAAVIKAEKRNHRLFGRLRGKKEKANKLMEGDFDFQN